MRYYTIKAVAQYHKVTKQAVFNWIHGGQLPSIKHGSKRLVPEDAVINFVKGRRGNHNPDSWPKSKVSEEDRIAFTEEYVTTHVTYQEIADRYGLTRERVRQLIKLTDPDAHTKHRALLDAAIAEREDTKRTKKLLAQMQHALDNDLHCAVCGAWVICRSGGNRENAGFLTCSPEHAVVWPILKTAVNTEEHRRQMARSILNHPETTGKSPSKKPWAEAILGNSPPPKNRTYIVPGSNRAAIIKKYRPELYEYLTHKCPTCHSTCVDHIHMAHEWQCSRCGTVFDNA